MQSKRFRSGISHASAAGHACPQKSTGEPGNSTALVSVLARGIARDTGASGRETRIPFPILLYNISPFWVPSMAQCESGLDDQQVRLYMEALERATISEVLAYLVAAGLGSFYKVPVHMIKKMILDESDLSSFLVFMKNQRGWLQTILKTLDPAGALKLQVQLETNFEAILIIIFLVWVNVSGVMHTLDDTQSAKRMQMTCQVFFSHLKWLA